MITQIKQPATYSPAYNPIVYTFSSDTSSLICFNVQVYQPDSSSVIYTGNIYPTPLNPSQASFNASKILASLVSSDIDNTNDLMIGKEKNILSYQLLVSENVLSGSSLVSINQFTGQTNYVYEAQSDILGYNQYTGNTFVISSGNTNTRFLTNEPDWKVLNEFSNEQLYVMQSGYTALYGIWDVKGNLYIDQYNVTPEIPEINAKASITITGTSAGLDNLYVIVNGVGLGAYSNTSSGNTAAQIALGLADAMSTNPYDYGISLVGTTIYITASGFTGTAGNATTISTGYEGSSTVSGVTTYFNPLKYTSTNFSGGQDDVPEVDDNPMDKMIRIQIAPKKLLANGYTDLTFNQNYSFYIQDLSGNTLTETRNYIYVPSQCNVDFMNVLFENSLGGVDTIQMVAPQESTTTTKLQIKTNNINLDADNVYVTNGIYNSENRVYAATTKSTIKAYTPVLTDNYVDWLIELYNSKNVYIELSNGLLLPVVVKTNTYNLQKQKYFLNELTQFQIEFDFDSNYLASLNNNLYIING